MISDAEGVESGWTEEKDDVKIQQANLPRATRQRRRAARIEPVHKQCVMDTVKGTLNLQTRKQHLDTQNDSPRVTDDGGCLLRALDWKE